MSAATEQATLGGGCFWCLEAVFEKIEGVERVVISLAPRHHGVGEHDADPGRDHCVMHTAQDPRGRVACLGMQGAVETLLVHATAQKPGVGPE